MDNNTFKEGFDDFIAGKTENGFEPMSAAFERWQEGYKWAERIAKLCCRVIEQKEVAELRAALEDRSLHITMWPPFANISSMDSSDY